ncbi:type III-B CRISPR module RAMP protein Cmr1, partial [Rhizobium hidalgonense]
MAIRIPDPSIKIPESDIYKQNGIQWHSLQCEVVTPMYGGGVEAATIDTKMPIRVSAIRGQLRFWWRLLAKNKWKLGNTKAIRDAEFALWGGMGDDSGGRASQVLIKVQQPNVTQHDLMDWQDALLPYVMFPASNETNPDISHQLLKAEKV